RRPRPAKSSESPPGSSEAQQQKANPTTRARSIRGQGAIWLRTRRRGGRRIGRQQSAKSAGRPPPCRRSRRRSRPFPVVSSPRTAPLAPCCYPSAPHPATRTTAQPAHFRMPVFQLHTNVSQDKVTPDLLKQISALVARILHKPESVRASSAF
ncbi:hypothetical protein ANCDUO_12056, partial [Ancylostoma duodenale]